MAFSINGQVRVYQQPMNPLLKEVIGACAIALVVNQIFGMCFSDMVKWFAIGFIAKQVVEGHFWQMRIRAQHRMMGNQ